MLDILSDCDAAAMEAAIGAAIAPDAPVHLCHPIGSSTGPEGFVGAALGPLWAAWPDVERRVDISITGTDGHGHVWRGQAGHYAGRASGPFMGIPATGRLAFLRFAEFFRIEDGVAVEVQAIWDLPDLMMQAGVWPMGPALGRTGLVPAPMTQDGLEPAGDGAHALKVVGDMLDRLHLSPQGEAAMELPRAWHPRCSWYGPGGIGDGAGHPRLPRPPPDPVPRRDARPARPRRPGPFLRGRRLRRASPPGPACR